MTDKDMDFDEELWEAADILRGNVAANDYRDIILGLVFLKYLSDSFNTRQDEIRKECSNPKSKRYTTDAVEIDNELNDRDNYKSENIFWVSEKSKWDYLCANAHQNDIGMKINNAMDTIEGENDRLKKLLPKKYLSHGLDHHNLGPIITLLTNVTAGKDKDLLGRVYEYYMNKFAERGGSKGGEYFTTPSVVKLLVEMLEPYKGRIFDPACGSGGMFVQSMKFIEAHQGKGKKKDLAIYGQENIEDYVNLCEINLAIRGIQGEIKMGNSYHNDLFKRLKADFVIANPPFNDKKWGNDRISDDDERFKYGVVSNKNANYMWIQHFISHLSNNGLAGFVMANGSLSCQIDQGGDIRKAIIEDDLIDCIVSLPEKLFYTTSISACLWFISKNKSNRKNKTFFIDAREFFHPRSKKHNLLAYEQIKKISEKYHKFKNGRRIKPVAGFCKVVSKKKIVENNYILTPGRYVGSVKISKDKEPFIDRVNRLNSELIKLFTISREIEKKIKSNMKRIA